MYGVTLTLRTPFYEAMASAIEVYYDPRNVSRIAKVAVALVTSPLSVALFLCAIPIDYVFAPRPYTLWKGEGTPKTTAKTIATWNACMLFGALSLPFGRVERSAKRIDAAAQIIITQSPDIISLQEISNDAAYRLYGKLRSKYTFFYLKINPNPTLSLDSHLFVASMVPLTDVTVTTLPPGMIRRASLSFKAAETTFTTAHLDPHSPEIRAKQARFLQNADVVFGDLNMTKEEVRAAFPSFPHTICGNSDGEARDDFILSKQTLRHTVVLDIPRTVSDHRPVVGTL